MGKIKKLWGYAVFRWAVYQTPLLVFGLLLKGGAFAIHSDPYEIYRNGSRDLYLLNWAVFIWVFALTLPAVWVWRKPLFGFLNKAAE